MIRQSLSLVTITSVQKQMINNTGHVLLLFLLLFQIPTGANDAHRIDLMVRWIHNPNQKEWQDAITIFEA